MFNQTAAYALRAVVHIASNGEDRPVGAKEVSDATEIPPNYLLKILRELVRQGLLDSARGVGGGFRVAKGLDAIRVRDIIKPFDDVQRQIQCPWGYRKCEGDLPCPVDSKWRPLVDAYLHFLENTTLDDMVHGPGFGACAAGESG